MQNNKKRPHDARCGTKFTILNNETYLNAATSEQEEGSTSCESSIPSPDFPMATSRICKPIKH